MPHDLGVLGHFKAVVWYLGDNRLTQDKEDVITDFFPDTQQAFSTGDAAVAERQQFLTMAVRDYLNEGGKLAYTGETTGYYGVLGTTLGGISLRAERRARSGLCRDRRPVQRLPAAGRRFHRYPGAAPGPTDPLVGIPTRGTARRRLVHAARADRRPDRRPGGRYATPGIRHFLRHRVGGLRQRPRRLVDSGAPAGSPPNTGGFKIGPPTVGASVTTRDTVMLGFGVEQIADATERATVLGDALRYLGVRGRR